MDGAQCLKDLVHTLLVLIHTSNGPHFVIFGGDAVFSREGAERSHTLKSFELSRELIFDEDSTLRGTEVGPSLKKGLSVEGLVNDSDTGSTVYSYAYHARDVVQMAFSKAFCAIKRVDPDDHVFLEEFIRELVIVVVSFRSSHTVDLLHLLQVTAVAVSLHIIVLDEHLLTDMILVELIGHDIGTFSHNLTFNLVLLANDLRSRVQLAQVVDHGVLDMDIDLSKDIHRTSTFL